MSARPLTSSPRCLNSASDWPGIAPSGWYWTPRCSGHGPGRRAPIAGTWSPDRAQPARITPGRRACPRSRAEDLALAVHELAVNAIQHGAGHGRLLMWQRDGMLHCRVGDDGPPGQARQDPAGPGENVAARWPRAQPHGLWLVRTLADQMTITSGTAQTRAAVTFGLPPRRGRPRRLHEA
jgi:anti-sigma regulatory factor (Ser/Thr protein kinase)